MEFARYCTNCGEDHLGKCPCAGCNGSGVCNHTDPEEHFICEECHGSGQFPPGEKMTSLARGLVKPTFTRLEVLENLVVWDRYNWGLAGWFVWARSGDASAYLFHNKYRTTIEMIRDHKFYDNHQVVSKQMVTAFWIRQALHILNYEKKHGRLPR